MEQKVNILVFEPHKPSYTMQVEDTLAGYQKIVGGYIQVAHTIDDEIDIVCKYMGLLDNLPKDRGMHGTFFAVGVKEGRFVSITDAQITKTRELYERKKNYQSKSAYLSKFFEEKQVKHEIYTFDFNDTFFSFDSEVVIQFLLNLEDKRGIEIIEDRIRAIDFTNADIHHFLKFIAKKLAEENYKIMEKKE